MKNKILLLPLAAALLAGGFIATKTHAATDDSATPAARGRIFQRIADKLDLTADQRASIKTILAGEKDTLKPLLTSLHDSRKNLRDAIRAKDASETSVRTASAKVAGVEADMAVERLKLFGKISPILTEEQRQKAAELQARADEFFDGAIARLGSGLDN
ncbi:MAG TPA: Spy/CpxP family protein refolding chaperone [Verrucomicrobiae bacterium]|nr:Spy/CpxP family protein refolding chaperone [Verrucomicrobiae bacterium]